MKFTDLFIRRPVLATVVNLFILLAGFQALKSLNIRQYPDVKNAVVTVTTAYPGASADLIRGFITTPLEREIASADGIDYVESSSSQNVSTITAKLRLNYPPNDALTQISSKVNKVRGELPADSEEPVIEASVGETMAAMYLSFSSETLDSNQITDYLTRVVQPKLATVQGVQKAEILGARTFAMRLWIKPDRLAAYNMSPSQLRGILSQQNYLSAVGRTKGSLISVNLGAQTDMKTVEEFKNMVLREENGKAVRLKDVADVVLGAENYDSQVKMGKQNATFMGIYALPTANVLDVIKGVRAIYPELQAQLPNGINVAIPYDSTEFIQESIDEVIKTLVEAMLIVIVVIFLFLGSVRSVIIPIVTIPLSLIGGMFLMMAFGFSINLLTLLAMVLAIGLVVDDAIVVLENVHRHIEEGLTPFDAAIKGAGELIGPVISMTITLAAVYAPIGLQSGLTGALFREFAFTLAGSVIISGVVALTLTPMMCSKLLKHDGSNTGLAHKLDMAFDKLKGWYQNLLHHALNGRKWVYAIAVVLLIAIIPFYAMSQKELAPTEDKGFMMAVATAAPNATIEQTSRYTNSILDRLLEYDETKQIFGIAGMGNTNTGFMGWVLKNWGDRKKSAFELKSQFQAEIAKTPGVNGGAFIPPPLPGSGGGLPVQFVVCSTDTPERVAQVANKILQRALESHKFYFGDTDLHFDQPQQDLVIDREKAGALGIPMSQLGADVGSLLGGGYVNRFSIEGRSYKVTPQVTRLARLNPEQIEGYYIATGKGKLVPLSTVASLKSSVQPRELKRFQQLNAATISLVPAAGVSLGDALEYLTAQAKELYPQGFTSDYNSELRQYVQEGSSMGTTFLLAIIIIYLVLAAQYESFRDPFVILMSVPLAITGAMVFIFLGAATINIYTQVGLITLVGLIAKHGILIVEFANELREQGRDARQAVEEAAAVRLRPILMTTAAMVLGVFPLLVATGAGAAARFSVGLVIATGMSIGTLFTLFVVPSFYILVAGNEKRDETTAAAEGHTH